MSPVSPDRGQYECHHPSDRSPSHDWEDAEIRLPRG